MASPIGGAVEEPPRMSFAEANATGGDSSLTTSFDIARRATIPSDGTQHKVTIAIVDLKPELSYEAIPSKVTNAFLVAKTVNTSPYAFLAGPTAIYQDNNYVAQVSNFFVIFFLIDL